MTHYELVKRTPVRLAAAFTTLFAATVVAVFAFLYLELGAQLEEDVRRRVDETIGALTAVDRERGFDAFASVVASESSSLRDADSIFLLVDRDGAYLAGNVDRLARFDGWQVLDRRSMSRVADRGNPADRFFVRWSEVSQGSLLVGGGDREIRDTQRLLLNALGWALLATVLLAAASAAVLAWRAQMRINALSTTLSAVGRGEIATRVPLSGADDDIDHIAEQINRTLGHLQRLIENVNQASSDIAHDLKKPIGRVRQRLERARREASSVEECRLAFDASLAELDSIVETFEALLRITQIEAGARKARFKTLDLAGLLRDVVDVYDPVVEDAGDRLTSAIDVPTPALVRGDRELLVQLFANLIENAIRHCPPGTAIRLSLADDGRDLAAVVADKGPGIPDAERDNVFRRLFRLERARSTPGNGLGLSLVAAVAELHDASVELGDNGPGLVVTVRFPKVA